MIFLEWILDSGATCWDVVFAEIQDTEEVFPMNLGSTLFQFPALLFNNVTMQSK